MENKELLASVKERANKWLEGNYDEETKKEVKQLLEGNEKELIDAFYQDLAFGTGGLRGIMGVGTNRMNIYTVGSATQGLCNYLSKEFSNYKTIKVAIAYDSRNNSRLFAEQTARICAANGFKVYLFDSLRPTPELSFAIRHLKCQSGVVITASHNPKEYNGYKVYWEDGGQIIAPHDKNIINEVLKINDIEEIKWEGKQDHIEMIGSEIDEVYTDKIKSLSLSPEAIQNNADIGIVFTPIHGSANKLVPMALKKLGFNQVSMVKEQEEPDGNFPTVESPNPEESAALNLAINQAKAINADLVMGTDPDADRVGIVVRNPHGKYVILNGNQAASILIYYLLTKWSEKGKLTGNEYIVKTIVTTELLVNIADKFGVEHHEVLTGFKYIADIIKRNEGKKTFIGGGEESYGYLVGDFVRDKDAVISCTMFAEITAWAREQGKSLYDILLEIYQEFGFFKEKLVSINKKGKEGADEIQRIMERFRNAPPDSINQSDVMLINDFQQQKAFDQLSHLRYDINLPKSNVLQFILKDNTQITLRPSGTEPKIKLYVSVKAELDEPADYENKNALLEEKISRIITQLGIE